MSQAYRTAIISRFDGMMAGNYHAREFMKEMMGSRYVGRKETTKEVTTNIVVNVVVGRE